MAERSPQANRFHRALLTAGCALALLTLAACSYRAILLATADWHFRAGDLHSIEKAEQIFPSNARYHFARALAIQQEDPSSGDVDRELARAVALNPRFSDAMLSWSVDKELAGDRTGAQKLLLDARAIDRQLRPSWALANFYFRQGDATRFWPQARECLRLIAVASFTTGRYDPVPIFALCWSMQPDAAAILSKAIPPDPQIEEIYLNYLLKYSKLDAQVDLVERILPRSTADDLWVLIPHINALILSGRVPTAVYEWDQLVGRKLLPYQPLDPAKGLSLTDGSFYSGPSGAGFDWKTVYPDPIRFSFLELEHTYRFEFDGNEPQQVDLLSQYAPVLPDRTYRLRSRYRAPFDATGSGINWTVTINSKKIAGRVVEGSAEDEKTLGVEFQTPPDASVATLLLNYQRQPGTTLIRGQLDLLQTSLTLQ